MNRSRRSSREIRRAITPRRPVFVGRQLVSGRGRQVTSRALFPRLLNKARPRTVLPLASWLSSVRDGTLGKFVPRGGGWGNAPPSVGRLSRVQRTRVRKRALLRPYFMESSTPCDRRRKTRVMMFVSGVAGRRWGSAGGPRPPVKRTLQSEVSCVR